MAVLSQSVTTYRVTPYIYLLIRIPVAIEIPTRIPVSKSELFQTVKIELPSPAPPAPPLRCWQLDLQATSLGAYSDWDLATD